MAGKRLLVLRLPLDFETSMEERLHDVLLAGKGYRLGEDLLVVWFPPLELQVPTLAQWLLNQKVL